MSLREEKKRVLEIANKKEIKITGPDKDNVITIKISTDERKAEVYKQRIVSLCEFLDATAKVSKSGKSITVKCANYSTMEIFKEFLD